MSDDPDNKDSAPLNKKEAADGKAPDETGPYAVGYGRPPKHTRFQKGQSGNKKGRPKGSLNLGLMLDKELNETVEVSERGRRRRMPKVQVGLRQLVNKLAGGDLPAFNSVQQLMARTGRLQEEADAGKVSAPAIDQRDVEALAGLLQFFALSEPNEGGSGGSGK